MRTCGFKPIGYSPCYRAKGHDGPCAHDYRPAFSLDDDLPPPAKATWKGVLVCAALFLIVYFVFTHLRSKMACRDRFIGTYSTGPGHHEATVCPHPEHLLKVEGIHWSLVRLSCVCR